MKNIWLNTFGILLILLLCWQFLSFRNSQKQNQRLILLENNFMEITKNFTNLIEKFQDNSKKSNAKANDIYAEGMAEFVNDIAQSFFAVEDLLDNIGIKDAATNEITEKAMQRLVEDYKTKIRFEEYCANMEKIRLQQLESDVNLYGKEIIEISDAAFGFTNANVQAACRAELLEKYPNSFAAVNAMSGNMIVALSTNNIDAALDWYDKMSDSSKHNAIAYANLKTLPTTQYMLANSLIEAGRKDEAEFFINALEMNQDDMIVALNIGRNRRAIQQLFVNQNRSLQQSAASSAKILREKLKDF